MTRVSSLPKVLGLAVLATLAGAASCGGSSSTSGNDAGTASAGEGGRDGDTTSLESSTLPGFDAGMVASDAALSGADGSSSTSDGSSMMASDADVAPSDAASVLDATSVPDATSKADGSLAQGPFACTEVIGLEITSEWWSAGFLSDGIDAAKFQLKWHHQGYIGAWADPNSPFWSNQGSAQDADAGAPIQSPCSQDSMTPDRVLLVAVDFDMVTEDAWVTALNNAVATVKMKYSPNLKWIDLTTLVRCPGDIMCNPNEDYGPGADLDVPDEDCYVPPYVDSAIAEVIAANADFVGLGPEPQATMCNNPVNGPHLSTASNTAAASAIAAYFVEHP
jgi:hypothetical protein